MRWQVITNEKDVVSRIQRGLSERIGSDRFELWFERGVRFRCEGVRLRVAAADAFTLERVRARFREAVEGVWREVAGPGGSVEYCVDRVAAAGRAAPGNAEAAAGEPAARRRERPELPRKGAKGRPPARLDTFVVGAGSRLAFAAAETAALQPGRATPVLLYGPPGVGKTHLLEGVWTEARRRLPAARLLFLSAEQFTTHFLEALKGGGLPSFRRKHRDLDLLVVDDLQFFAGKRATLVELHHTVDALLREGRQLVFAADRPPSELTPLGAELAARLAGGLVCGLTPPDETTRRRILLQMAGRRGVALPDAVADYVARHLGTDARQLLGALHRLEAASRAVSQPITVELAREWLADLIGAASRPVQLEDIERAVCRVFGLDAKTLRSDSRSPAVSHPRMLAMWLARRHTRAAFSEIGRYFGRRTHSTVIAAERKVARWLDENAAIRVPRGSCPIAAAVERVEGQLRAG